MKRMGAWLALLSVAAVATVALVTVFVVRGGPAERETPVGAAEPSPGAATELVVYRSPECSCCEAWITYMERHGYRVRSVTTDDLGSMKKEHRVPEELWSCHTAVLGNLVVEGHVPVEAVRAALERASVGSRGIAVPGMPAGSPGMPGTLARPLEVFAFGDDGVSTFLALERFAP